MRDGGHGASAFAHPTVCGYGSPMSLYADQHAPAAPPAGPLAPAQRIEALHVVCGLALLGVVAIHAVFEFRVSIFAQFLPDDGGLCALDRAVQNFLNVAVVMKAFALFSLLFGAGLAIQFERLAQNPRRIVLLVR